MIPRWFPRFLNVSIKIQKLQRDWYTYFDLSLSPCPFGSSLPTMSASEVPKNCEKKYEKVRVTLTSEEEDVKPNVNVVDVDMEESTDKKEVDIYSRENIPFTTAVLPSLLAAGADYFGLGVIGPLLPYFVIDTQGQGEAWVGYVTTAQFLGVLIGGLVMSRIGDIYGLKVAIQTAMAADVIFFILSGYASTVEILCLCRFFAGFFTPLVPSISWIINASDARPTAKRNTVGGNMALWAFSMSISYMGGALLAGLMGPENWSTVHVITGCVAFVAFIYFFLVTEPPRYDSKMKPEGVDVILRQPEYLALCLNNVSVGMVFTGGLVAASLVLLELDGTPQQMSYYFLFCSLTHGVINFLALPWAIQKYGTTFPAMSAVAVMASICTILLCFDFAYDSLSGLFVLMVGTSCVIPIFMTAANIINGEYAARYTKNARTVVLGMARSAFNIGQVLGPVIAVAFLKWDRVAWFVGIMLIILTTWTSWHYYHHRAIILRAHAEADAVAGRDASTESERVLELVE